MSLKASSRTFKCSFMFCLTKCSDFCVGGISPFIKIIQLKKLSSSQRCQNYHGMISAGRAVYHDYHKRYSLLFPYSSPNCSEHFIIFPEDFYLRTMVGRQSKGVNISLRKVQYSPDYALYRPGLTECNL